MLDIVYPYKAASDHLEINVSIKSLRKFVPIYRNIYIIGDNPQIEGTIHIQAYDNNDLVFGKNRNIMEKIYLACTMPAISDDFLMMNDDFFWLKQTDITNYPYYSGSFQHILDRKDTDIYKQELIRTMRDIDNFQYFDIHKPIIYNKVKFMDAMGSHNWRLPKLVKSLYCNYWNITGKPTEDHKGTDIPDADMFSFPNEGISQELHNKLVSILEH